MRTIKNYVDQRQHVEARVLWHVCQNSHKELLLCKSHYLNVVIVVVIQMMNINITECLQNYIISIMLILLSY